jgi:pyruvate dehydrogenase E2 component (dihydrolipoamide acetyltransferase)
MPKLSDTMTEGTLVSWKKKKGDKVSTGDVIAEIETDKATMEWESPEDGTLTEIYVEEGGKVNVGDKIAFIGEQDEEAPARKKEEREREKRRGPPPKQRTEKEKAQKETDKPAPAKVRKETAPPQEKPRKLPLVLLPEEARVKASPVARRIAAELGVDLSRVNGTGPEGRVTEIDVRAAAKSKTTSAPQKPVAAAKPAPTVKAGEGARIQLSGMRKIIAQRLVESLGPVPHFYLNIDIDAGPLMAAREELKSAGEDADTAKITVNDFVLKAAVQAAVKVPRVNASFDDNAIVQYAEELRIAVAIEDGLLTQ